MALEMKSECQSCAQPTPIIDVAYICSFECTFCVDCANQLTECPECGGELLPRPRRGTPGESMGMTRHRLASFDRAWALEDLETLASLITDDCVYAASIGPEPGTTYRGREQVLAGFEDILRFERKVRDTAREALKQARNSAAASPETADNRLFVYGDRGFARWQYPERSPDGMLQIVRGCDFFEFRGNKIRYKDAFIKRRLLPGED